jgi:hypothetical protein
VIQPGRGEQGFVLLAAIWLLILAGSIVALLMLDSVNVSRQARDEGDILRSRLALDAAVETIIADRIMNGDRSIWSRAPAQGAIDIEGLAVQVRATSEAERIDINRASPQVIDARLQKAGLAARERQLILGRVALEKGGEQRLRSLSEVQAVFADASRETREPCIAELFTPFAGGRTSDVGIMAISGEQGAAGAQSAPVRAGTIQRMEVRAQRGVARMVVLRTIGQQGATASMLEWRDSMMCDA